MEESGGKFPPLWINSRRGKSKRKRRKKKEKRKEKKSDGEGKGRKGEERKREIFPAFRRSKLDGPSIKINPRNVSYTWVPKSRRFVKLQEVENFPT